MVDCLRWGRRKRDAWLHPARHAARASKQTVHLHCHTFFEVFWIEEGQGWHQINDRRIPLAVGDCVFIRPDDVHGMLAAGQTPMAWTNVTLHADAEARLRGSYEKELGWWPWQVDRVMPHHLRLERGQLDRLREYAASLPLRDPRELDQEWFIASLLRLIAPPTGLAGIDLPPDWLASAVRAFSTDPTHLQAGVPNLVQLAGRCAEHVNRVVRQYYGMTATDLVRHFRLEYAARQLRISGNEILTIAMQSGFDNLSYFYRSFRKHYGTTPRRFRLQSITVRN